mmetsp:Transcript_29793/g.22093  ORF Transcript_29793/g.22093 Transcript_29793/m.22093 type:complete len:107 (-) Transcript_29793:41-361(-)
MSRAENKLIEEEIKLSDRYHLDISKRPTKNREQYLREEIRNDLVDSGYPSQKVDEVFKRVKALPQKLVDSYFAMLDESVRTAIKDNEDLDLARKNNNKQFAALLKL